MNNSRLRNLRSVAKRYQEDFERRKVLAAIDGSQRSRFSSTINSPAFLWFVTLAFITCGGAYIARYDACQRYADDLAEAYFRAGGELDYRFDYYARSVLRANNIAEIRDSFKSVPSIFHELEDRTSLDLQRDITRYQRRIDFTAARHNIQIVAKERPSTTVLEIERYSQLTVGNWNENLKEEELPEIKSYFEKIHLPRRKAHMVEFATVKLEPVCGPLNVISGVRSRGNQKVLEVRYDKY